MLFDFLRIPEIEQKLGLMFKDKEIIALAFIHSSFWNEHKNDIPNCNERLEFLGDSILNLIVSEFLYSKYPSYTEGLLSHYRSSIVDSSSCAAYSRKLDLEKYLLLGKGEQANSGKGRETILADLFEAIMGAIYLDLGFNAVKDFFFRNFSSEIHSIVSAPLRNWKAELQEYVQKRFLEAPVYEVVNEWGPPHQKNFRIAVIVNKERWGEGEGYSKKDAQQKAAFAALEKLIKK